MHLETGPQPTDPPSVETGGGSGLSPALFPESSSPLSKTPLPMPVAATPPVRWPVTRFRVLAGLQAGVVGGLAMLCFYSFASTLQHQHWWSYENLLGSAVYGNAAFFRGLSRVTVAGAGLQIVLSGIAGVICSFLLPPFRGYGMVQFLVALATSTLWYVFEYQILFPAIAPLIPAYGVRNLPVVAHLLLGISLSRIPAMYEELVRHHLSSVPSSDQSYGRE